MATDVSWGQHEPQRRTTGLTKYMVCRDCVKVSSLSERALVSVRSGPLVGHLAVSVIGF